VAHAIALDAAGRIVAAGTVERTATGWDFGLVRYAADGSLEPTFGFGGRVTTDFGIAGREDKTDEAFAVAIQPDGKIVAAGVTGRCGTSNGYAALARYGSDGALDSSFGEGGLVYTDFPRECDAFNAVAVQQDGKIVAAGFTGQGGVGQDRAFLVARYDADGGLDPTFGSGGSVLTDFGSARFDEARAVVLQPDGKVVVAGFSSGAKEGKIALARYLFDGQLDPGFGNGGMVTTSIPPLRAAAAFAVTLQPDRKIVVAGSVGGSSSGGNADFALVRYTRTGAVDQTFGLHGRVVTALQATADVATAVGLEADGRIVAGGYSEFAPAEYDFAAAVYLTDGSLDASFGEGGKVLTAFGPGSQMALGLAVQPDGKLVLAGSYREITTTDFSLARYLPA
jgi:uncharacterized delta-60 repeat protein